MSPFARGGRTQREVLGIFLVALVALVAPSPTLQDRVSGDTPAVPDDLQRNTLRRRECLRAPVEARIAGRFEPPACPYCAGRRTVDFDAASGAAVVAPTSGTVTFVGVVAGTPFITIGVAGPPHERLVTLGGVVPPQEGGIARGSTVRVGQVIGEVGLGLVRLSVRAVVPGRTADYVDPEPMIGRWRGPVRLVPEADQASYAPRRVSRSWSCLRPLLLVD